MGVQAIYQTIGPKVLGKTKVFYCLIYVLGHVKVPRAQTQRPVQCVPHWWIGSAHSMKGCHVMIGKPGCRQY